MRKKQPPRHHKSLEQWQHRLLVRLEDEPETARKVAAFLKYLDEGEVDVQERLTHKGKPLGEYEISKRALLELQSHGILTDQDAGAFSCAELLAIGVRYSCYRQLFIASTKGGPQLWSVASRWPKYGPSVAEIPLSTRLKGLLAEIGITHLGELEYIRPQMMMTIANFGQTCLSELRTVLARENFRMRFDDPSNWP